MRERNGILASMAASALVWFQPPSSRFLPVRCINKISTTSMHVRLPQLMTACTRRQYADGSMESCNLPAWPRSLRCKWEQRWRLLPVDLAGIRECSSESLWRANAWRVCPIRIGSERRREKSDRTLRDNTTSWSRLGEPISQPFYSLGPTCHVVPGASWTPWSSWETHGGGTPFAAQAPVVCRCSPDDVHHAATARPPAPGVTGHRRTTVSLWDTGINN